METTLYGKTLTPERQKLNDILKRHRLGIIDKLQVMDEVEEFFRGPIKKTGRCEKHKQPGGCDLHNLFCGYPQCDEYPITKKK